MCSAQPAKWRLLSGTGSESKVASLRLVAYYGSEWVSEAVVASGQIAGIETSAFSRTAIIATRHHDPELQHQLHTTFIDCIFRAVICISFSAIPWFKAQRGCHMRC
jgi:hypothetical protein